MFLFFFLSHSYTSWSIISIFLCFSEMVYLKQSEWLRRGRISFCSHLFQAVTFCIFSEETKTPLTGEIEGSAWFSLLAHPHIALRNNQTVHYHRDFTPAVTNILTALELRRGFVICTAAMFCQRSCLYCLGLKFCVYKNLTNTYKM